MRLKYQNLKYIKLNPCFGRAWKHFLVITAGKLNTAERLSSCTARVSQVSIQIRWQRISEKPF